MKQKKDKGFSLIELITVVVVIAILAALAAPSFVKWLPNMHLKAAARDFYSGFQRARMEAIKRNEDVVVQMNTVNCTALPHSVPSPGGGLVIFVDDGSGGGIAKNQVQDGSEMTLLSLSMPSHTAFCSETFTGTTTGFNSNGLVINNNIGIVTLNNDQGRSYQLSLTIAGGIRLQ